MVAEIAEGAGARSLPSSLESHDGMVQFCVLRNLSTLFGHRSRYVTIEEIHITDYEGREIS